METPVVLGHIVLHCSQHCVILNHWESSSLRAQKSDVQMWRIGVCHTQDSLHDIIGEDEDARDEAVQEDENQS